MKHLTWWVPVLLFGCSSAELLEERYNGNTCYDLRMKSFPQGSDLSTLAAAAQCPAKGCFPAEFERQFVASAEEPMVCPGGDCYAFATPGDSRGVPYFFTTDEATGRFVFSTQIVEGQAPEVVEASALYATGQFETPYGTIGWFTGEVGGSASVESDALEVVDFRDGFITFHVRGRVIEFNQNYDVDPYKCPAPVGPRYGRRSDGKCELMPCDYIPPVNDRTFHTVDLEFRARIVTDAP